MSQLQQQLEQLLQQTYGYGQFRTGQLEIIMSLVQGRDVLAILPTGGGKSICFQIPGLYLGGTTLVISPLISLMQDQVDNLIKRGLRATFINSSLSRQEQQRRLRNMQTGQYQFIYLAPEKLESESFRQLCRHVKITLIAIDEAHCVSVWGHDFRPSYLRLSQLLTEIFDTDTRPPIIALTATANKQAQADIIAYCGLRQPQLVQQSFARDNLKILVHKCHNEHDKLLHILCVLQKHAGQIGIIYVLTRKQAVFLADKLNQLLQPDKTIKVYHGGLDKHIRQTIQEEFISGRTPVIVATNAFGMGVDQPHVRYVIHAQISSNLENYFQEIGRGGRDGEIAYCYAFYTVMDLQISLEFIRRNQMLSRQRQKVLSEKLKKVQKYLTLTSCRQAYVLRCFDEKRNGWRCQMCDNCCHYSWSYPPTVKEKLRHWQNWRKRLAKQQRLIPSSIITDLSLSYLAIIPWRRLPQLAVIPGIGRGFVERFGKLLPE